MKSPPSREAVGHSGGELNSISLLLLQMIHTLKTKSIPDTSYGYRVVHVAAGGILLPAYFDVIDDDGSKSDYKEPTTDSIEVIDDYNSRNDQDEPASNSMNVEADSSAYIAFRRISI